MKTNSYNKATGLVLVAVAVALIVALEPAAGQDPSQFRRDRSRRDTQSGPTQGRQDSGARPDAARFDRNRRDPRTSQDAGRQGMGPQSKDSAGRGPNSPRNGRITGPADQSAAGEFFDQGAKDEQWTTKYQIILKQNMFSRDRIPPQDTQRRLIPPVVNPESYFLLRGVSHEDYAQGTNRLIAFVEDKQSGSVLRLHEGDHVARGQIKSLTLDGFEYLMQGKETPTAVNLGHDLEGHYGGAVTASDLANLTPSAAPAAAGAPAGQSAAPSADEAEILKRLMEQRQKQLGQ